MAATQTPFCAGRTAAVDGAPQPLARFAAFTAFCSFFVLFAGGMVTSTGSGLAVPDWPMSYGTLNPKMVDGVFFEHGHRAVAGFVAVLTWALMFWLHAVEKRRWLRRLSLAAAGFIVVQAVLGGVTVLYGLPKEVSIVHACLGQALFCTLWALAVGLGPRFSALDAQGAESGGLLWKDGALAAVLLFFQLILGASLRHTGSGLVWHLLGAAAAFWAVTRAAMQGLEAPRLRGLSMGVAGLILLQLFLGIGALIGRSSRTIAHLALLPTLHQAAGALILGMTVVWTLKAWREKA